MTRSAEAPRGETAPVPRAGWVPFGAAGRLVVLVALPLLLIGALLWLFVRTGAGLELEPPVPVEALAIERVVLEPDIITLHVRNAGPEELTIALVSVNDSIWPATASPSNVIPRLGSATLTLHYPWVEGEAYEVLLITANSVTFEAEIPVAFASPQPTPTMLGSFTLIGIYVGVLPVAIGVLWLRAIRQVGRRIVLFLTALTAGILAVLGIETLAEAIAQANAVPGPFQGLLLVGIGTVGTFVLLSAVGARQQVSREGADWRLRLAYLIALGIGMHNLGEGLAIGAAYAVGEVVLGTFLIVGFFLQNVTEGVAIAVPILRDRLPVRHIALLVLLAGAPAIAGTWIGGFTFWAVFAALFLGIGAGAIFQVLYQVGLLARHEAKRLEAPLVAFAGLTVGMLLLYSAGLLVK